MLAAKFLAAAVCFAADAPRTPVGDVEIQLITSKILENTGNLRVLRRRGYHDMINRHGKCPVMFVLVWGARFPDAMLCL